jgi:hypothetical protein
VLIDDKPIGVALNRNLGSPTAPGEAAKLMEDQPKVAAWRNETTF